MNDAYENLAVAIIQRAVNDYTNAYNILNKQYYAEKVRKSAQAKIKKLEKFFKGEWFCMLADVDGERFLRQLQERCEDGGKGIYVKW